MIFAQAEKETKAKPEEKPVEVKKDAPLAETKPVDSSTDATKGNPEKSDTVTSDASNKKQVEKLFHDKEFYSKAEVEALLEVLKKKTTELDQDIDTQKSYLESLKKQVEENLKKVESARTEIADFMNTRDEKEEGKLKKLARFYEAMDAEQAAPLLKDVSDELAIKIFDRMDTKKAGTILAQLPPQRAARLTQAFPKLKLQADKVADAN